MNKSGGTGRALGRRVLADTVHEEILAALLDGRYEPGASLSIDGLAREFDVSPTPVREALARLESTGMVQRFALRGYRVASLLQEEEFVDLMEARLAIEPVNSRLMATRRTEESLAALRAAVHDQATAQRGPSFAEFRDYYEADERFHQLIAQNSGNQFLLTAHNSLGGLVQRFRLFSGVGVTDADTAVPEHEAILAAIERGSAEDAEAAMAAHICLVRDRSISELRAH
ncbi:GntR family transcriptional regulator [Mycetocola spongiae]|uniref:GntR family transcriptional regulator n=1 Tax=Mycetocola spongiae TaxID=2859226 RepID=UPI001CF5E076|nr:GntR family transcriptional regulator [Mycetocola spongiae]UCR88163.1 GntR family transcriptional regulator [Mycetocola spongiae]